MSNIAHTTNKDHKDLNHIPYFNYDKQDYCIGTYIKSKKDYNIAND